MEGEEQDHNTEQQSVACEPKREEQIPSAETNNVDESDKDSINTLQDETVEKAPTTEDGLTESERSLHEAVKQGDYEIVKSMLTAPANTTLDVNKKDKDNWSCLHEACIHTCQFNEIARLLLQHGADPNIRDSSGETPLHGSVLFHYTDNVRLLCEYNADFNACNNEGISSLDIAEHAKDTEMLEIFGRSLPAKKGKCSQQRKKVGRRSVLRIRNTDDLNYIPSPLSSPSILKKRKRISSEEEGVGPSPKKSISFSPKDRYTPSPLYR